MEDLPSLRDHPLHSRPMPVDYEVCPQRQDEPITVPSELVSLVGPKARASVAVFRDTGREWVPESYVRSPWAVIRAKQRELMTSLFFSRPNTVTNYAELTNGTNHSFNATGASSAHFNAVNNHPSSVTLRWGTNNTAATDGDFRLATEADNLTATIAFDLTNYLSFFSGSKIYTGAPVTLNELGLSILGRNTASQNQTILLDRTVVAPVSVGQNRTVAIEYDWQF